MTGTRRRGGVLALLTVALASCASPNGAGPGDSVGFEDVVDGNASPPSDVPLGSKPPSGPQTPAGTLDRAGLPTLAPPDVLARVPTRVRIADLGIDLPVVVPPPNPGHFPWCDVAEFLPTLSRPGRAGTTYIYAHARPGMFLPILERSYDQGGRSLIGVAVVVFTSDARRFTYQVTEVQRHVTSLEPVYRATAEQLVLQTSEGPSGTAGKTLLIARPIAEQAASPDEAIPAAHPRECR